MGKAQREKYNKYYLAQEQPSEYPTPCPPCRRASLGRYGDNHCCIDLRAHPTRTVRRPATMPTQFKAGLYEPHKE